MQKVPTPGRDVFVPLSIPYYYYASCKRKTMDILLNGCYEGISWSVGYSLAITGRVSIEGTSNLREYQSSHGVAKGRKVVCGPGFKGEGLPPTVVIL